ncbi:MAG TPA: hypothetical protein PK244_10865, partial [Pseudomonadales bacterium]|nr:hypothetical protein [Pseudomonadales bacterium]
MSTLCAHLRCRRHIACQKTSNSLIQIRFTRYHADDSALPEPLLQATTNTASDQHIDFVQGMRLPLLGFMKRLLNGQLQQASANNTPLFDVVNPELPALARMLGHCLAILTAHGNFERLSECWHFCHLGLRRATAATTAAVRVRMPMITAMAATTALTSATTVAARSRTFAATATTAATAMRMAMPTTTATKYRRLQFAIFELGNCLLYRFRVGAINSNPLFKQRFQGNAVDT